MTEHDDTPARMVRLMWLLATMTAVVAVVSGLAGHLGAFLGFAAATVGYLTAVLCADRWRVWRGVSDSFINGDARMYWTPPPDDGGE